MHSPDMRVPLLDLKRQYGPLKSQILAAIEQVADSQHLVLGPQVEQIEAGIASYTGAGHAIGVSSGTDAQLVLLMALGIGPGDVVITSPYTFFATAGCVERLGARVVFADIDPLTYNLSVQDLGRALAENDRVKAIIPIHLFGCCADMEPIIALAARYGAPILEDAAQALGARHPLGAAGAIAEAGWYSFYPTKNLGAFGDAGMVTCRDAGSATTAWSRGTSTARSAATSGWTPFRRRCSTSNFPIWTPGAKDAASVQPITEASSTSAAWTRCSDCR
jgi:dTDP-4-amino-4,6-dideoxygalactose transaminase